MLGSDGVQLSGRDVAERLRYERWVAQYDTLYDADRAAIRAHITELAKRPLNLSRRAGLQYRGAISP